MEFTNLPSVESYKDFFDFNHYAKIIQAYSDTVSPVR